MIYRPLRYEQIMRAAESYDVRARRMFGGMGVYTGERMFAFLIGEDIGLKLSPEDVIEALELPGAEPLRPSEDAEPMKDYVRMPRSVLDDYVQFVHWLERAISNAQRRVNSA
ncbi:MAG TPA: TfoX/Sxy family protein [Fimbriimonadaceae bacterium]|nr:TfoX/Sxy family protein [Fimbriimonadaceae bacterium]